MFDNLREIKIDTPIPNEIWYKIFSHLQEQKRSISNMTILGHCIPSDYIEEFCQMFSLITGKLKLQCSPIIGENVQYVFKYFKGRELVIYKCDIQDSVFPSVISFLRENNKIKILDLRANNFTSKSIKLIIEEAKKKKVECLFRINGGWKDFSVKVYGK
ncbi:Conserved_hypothetical protein [Hexamita inflata]|uniref:Uncharacterized protein n=1 Tax=Hexamita inflata TaxID=28002 RepID=A0AA86NK32_9EUKA|nr:Conserved hypothetical protein [Hexamita inflata]CAI9920716.1 Conserved hypothetical protein [Hexamita inflata]